MKTIKLSLKKSISEIRLQSPSSTRFNIKIIEEEENRNHSEHSFG
jgi:hypothetical protein